MTKRLKHVGVDAFLAERKSLLDAYDKAKQQTADDSVKIEHGIAAEDLMREWLCSFLPKIFDICKGYIITTNLEYEGPIEEWDIIIYDALEAPTLFSRTGSNQSIRKRAIPIEYVRAVIEVKATFNPPMAEKAANKLLKLLPFLGTNTSSEYPQHFCQPFICSTIFFETAVANFKQYRDALDKLSTVLQIEPILPFMGGLILRSQREHNHSGYLEAFVSDEPTVFSDEVSEMSTVFQYPDNKFGWLGCFGYGINSFSKFLFDLLANIKGIRSNRVSSFYGQDYENSRGSRLFH